MIFSEALLGCALGGNLQNNNSFSSIEIVFVVFKKKFLGKIFFSEGTSSPEKPAETQRLEITLEKIPKNSNYLGIFTVI